MLFEPSRFSDILALRIKVHSLVSLHSTQSGKLLPMQVLLIELCFELPPCHLLLLAFVLIESKLKMSSLLSASTLGFFEAGSSLS